MSAATVFKALGDESRLEILSRIGTEPICIRDVAVGLAISRQGVRKHLAILADAHLIRLEPIGREVLIHAEIAGLDAGRAFIEATERRWDQRLSRLKKFVEVEEP